MNAGRSLRSRLAWTATTVTAAWLVALAVGAALLLSAALSRQAEGVLLARAEATAATIRVANDGSVTVADVRDDQALDVGTWIFDGSGATVESPAGSSPSLDEVAASLAGRGQRSVDTGTTDPLRLLALPVVQAGEQQATVVTSASLAPYRELQRAGLIALAVVGPLVLLGVYLVSRITLGRALRPVQLMSTQAGQWSADHVERRFGLQPRPAELAELAATLDGMLDRLSAVLRHERQLSAELSHELRTPLARIQAEIDLMRSRPRAVTEQARAHEAIDAAVERMRQVLESLISTARAEGGALSGRCSPAEIVTSLVDRLRAATPTLTVSTEASIVAGVDAPILERLLSPLIDNAVRHAASRVSIGIRRVGGWVQIEISDDGPGIPADAIDRIFEPGFRADPADGHDGAGLGLALTRRLVQAVDGTITAANGSIGPTDADGCAGAVFTVCVPAS